MWPALPFFRLKTMVMGAAMPAYREPADQSEQSRRCRQSANSGSSITSSAHTPDRVRFSPVIVVRLRKSYYFLAKTMRNS